MGTKLDWRRARALDLSEPRYKERRLDQVADNWLDHGSLNRKQPEPPKKVENGRKQRRKT